MSNRPPRESVPIRKIRSLSPDHQLTKAAAKLAEKAFRRVWDNPADAAYDRL